VTGRDTRLARRIAGAVGELGLCPAGATAAESPRPVQMLEMAIDALGHSGHTTANCDPDGNLGSDTATSVTNVRSPLPGSDELTQAWASYPRIEPIDLEPTGWRMR
jgi:hypothetical protein